MEALERVFCRTRSEASTHALRVYGYRKYGAKASSGSGCYGTIPTTNKSRYRLAGRKYFQAESDYFIRWAATAEQLTADGTVKIQRHYATG